MSTAALMVYQTIRAWDTQKSVLDLMQTRADLHQALGYQACEQRLDRIFAQMKKFEREKCSPQLQVPRH